MKKIVNVTPGILPIPPNGWGAVEKIIWEFHNNLLALGYDSHITYLDDVPSDADIVHIHVANLALTARERGIPYYFTLHDHHAFLYGKDSFVYKQNLEAMQHAIKSFVPAKYLVDYFDGIPEYFSHGVNTKFFSLPKSRSEHKLLCVANNGYIHSQSEDRKGFGIAIESARALGLPITIAGPSNNKNYFENNPSTYDKLTILYDVTEQQLSDLYKSHSIFVHPSELEAGHPNLTLLEALASGLPVVGTLESNNNLGGMIITGRDAVDVTLGIQEVMLHYDRYTTDARIQAEQLSWHNRTQELIKIYTGNNTQGVSMIFNLDSIMKKYSLNIRGIVHIGAHYGQEYGAYKQLGIENVMFFEPVPATFEILKHHLGHVCVLHNVALGNVVGEIEMNIEDANQGQSSSILTPDKHLEQYPHIQFTKKIKVPINKLDAYNIDPKQYNMISVDVQGYELEVFKGGATFLNNVDCILTEVNRDEVYKGCAKIEDLIAFLSPYGFELVEVEWAGGIWGDACFVKRKPKQDASDMKLQLINHYENTKQLNLPTKLRTNFNNIDGMFAELLGGKDTNYKLQFIDKSTNNTVFSTEIGRNCWAKTNIQYFVDWKVIVTDTSSGATIEYNLDLRNKRVLISFESKSLGDTIAWIPYVEEFRKKHGCNIICSTFWNDFFKEEYKDIEFVNPGEEVHNLHALYRIGLFYNSEGGLDTNRHPKNPIEFPLQQTAADILGIEYNEILPKIKQPSVDNVDSKQVSIAIHSTAQAKYWNNPLGWQTIVNWLNNKGYTVRLISQEGTDYMGNKAPSGVIHHPAGSIESVMDEIKKSKAFIGISSGLSWLSWALQVPTVLISGFTDPINEMKDCIRIGAPIGKCSGCWHRHKFNPGDWNWCPDHKGTPRQFECSREITADMVIKELEKIL